MRRRDMSKGVKGYVSIDVKNACGRVSRVRACVVCMCGRGDTPLGVKTVIIPR